MADSFTTACARLFYFIEAKGGSENYTYGDGTGVLFRMVKALGKSISDSFAEGAATMFTLAENSGFTTGYGYGLANADYQTALKSSGNTVITSDGNGESAFFTLMPCSGATEINTDATAKARMWYKPIQVGDTLIVRSVYESTLTDDVLEIK